MKFTEIPASFFEPRPEIGTTKSRKWNEPNAARRFHCEHKAAAQAGI